MKLATRIHGDHAGGARTLLWVHGYTLDASIWEPLWRLLPEYRHVGVDLPGHGASAHLAAPDLPAAGRALLETAREVGARDVVAMSFGGLVSIQAAIEASGQGSGDAIAKLVLASPAIGGGPQDPESLECNLALMRDAAERGAGPWLRERWMSCPPRIFEGASRHPELMARLREVVGRHSFDELRSGVMRALTAHVHAPRDLARIRAATLLLVGEDDMESFKRTAELIRRNVPRCAREYVTGAGHMALLERPSETCDRIRAHFDPRG